MKTKWKLLELKNKITKIQNLLNGLTSRIEMTEERFSKLENRIDINYPIGSGHK